jgi:hypothetical protein
MRRGPPALGAPMAGSFGLFLLPRGRPRCFFPVVVDPAVAEEEEGSMALGSSLSLLRWRSSTGGKWSVEEVERVQFKEGRPASKRHVPVWDSE